MEFRLRKGSNYIELIQLLKVCNLASSGGQAQQMVVDKKVLLNGNIELRKRAKLKSGDKVEVLGQLIEIK
ncbi:hypothetical protein A2X44_03590 [candidate division CPR3 bacterium GWF2_35_18]|uniref:Uncharacterized protein n=1 Tax=candidate division CPR3 bacterium GW2011_GWF2_35_18 TaxID=1618350 RepID=A0A0G0E315_UNCC3|nr:MAG: hypothetical protein UR67_C0004G0007 [candidate division CPR3 bacterium GW2011_GWF2_35_18]KKP86237.1 MAG: hypothetical protein UR87_C0025G0007 [candidate division CPR3 bacterium GW2011_GWE2_35_7]OGB63097.1 MAG: hypothetical protein A2X44_03590 [candidate division CPR3 bacterium GWF2_35_18]OGB64089.1 MAG: hypothetical protein A2250_04800 [candidate division CPR3 bacterium RIFOXYA2_FULL_35_13]OGB75841.1 MAG: hypothetical protein A2476_00600 [candidate division CPR3 bacterium RIFOXYC2_FULL